MAKEQTNGNLALGQQRVIVIPAHDEIVARKLRIAAYARVSSSSEDQLNSYRVQNQYYSELISNNPDWEMVDIYADEGITGTSVEKREDFLRMMQDCRKGKIDHILVKSISRFARNTKECLAAVRELKELGVSVLFEEQGIDTARVSSEMVTAIMASLSNCMIPKVQNPGRISAESMCIKCIQRHRFAVNFCGSRAKCFMKQRWLECTGLSDKRLYCFSLEILL